jgi:low affinity Fe/Cu permease
MRRLSDAISRAGRTVSSCVADFAANPLSQVGVIAFCLIWWGVGLPTDVLTATLSIAAITLTQMVLNSQRLREDDDRRRDVAMHAKLDELLRAEKFARKELAGIEELEAEEIAALKLKVSQTDAKDQAKDLQVKYPASPDLDNANGSFPPKVATGWVPQKGLKCRGTID